MSDIRGITSLLRAMVSWRLCSLQLLISLFLVTFSFGAMGQKAYSAEAADRVGRAEIYLATTYIRNNFLLNYSLTVSKEKKHQETFYQLVNDRFRLNNRRLIEVAKYSDLDLDSAMSEHRNVVSHDLDSMRAYYIAHPEELSFHHTLDEDPLPPQQPQFCDNMDFESCNFSNWEIATGTVNNVPYGFVNRVVTGAFGNSIPVDDGLQHYIVSNAAWTDPTVGIQCVKPGGNCSAVLGDRLGDNYNAASMRRTFQVTADNYFFSYSYAVIMEDPTNEHTPGERPYFTVRIFDDQGGELSCSSYEVYSGDGNPAWQDSPNRPTGTPIVYTDWTDAFIPLQSYIGQTVTIEFSVGDCNLGGHAAYAYVEANCGSDILATDTFTCPNIPVTLTAPGGASSYLWSTGETTQSIEVADSGLYQVTMGATADPNCLAILQKRIYLKSAPTSIFSGDTVCLTHPTTFSESSLPALDGLVNWEWDFDNDGTFDGNGQGVQHVYPAAGDHTVRLRVTDGNGCFHDTTHVVRVHELPSPSFSWNPACEGTETNLSNTSTGATSQVWDLYNDGSTLSTALNENVLFTPAGTYPVKLITTNEFECSDSVTNNVVINPNPVADFAAVDVCFPEAVNFIDASTVSTGNIVQWLWEFGDGNVAFTPNPSHTYTAFDNYSVKLTILTDSACLDTVRKSIQYHDKPVAAFLSNDTCANEEFQLIYESVTSTGSIVDWKWDVLADGTVDYTSANASHTFALAGTYDVRLIVTNSQNCIDTTSRSVTIHALPSAAFDANSVCLGDSTALTSTSTGDVIDTWNWDIGNDGTIEGVDSSFNLILPNYGTTDVKLQVKTDKGCLDSVVQAVTVRPRPIADFDFANQCFPNPISFQNSSNIAVGAIVSQNWDFGDGIGVGASVSEIYSYPASGEYSVQLTVQSDNGCLDSITKVITVFEKPLAAFSVEDDCEQQAFELLNTSTVGSSSITNWSWDVSVNNSIEYTTENPSHVFLADGVDSVRLIVETDEGCRDSVVEQVTIHPLPTAFFSVNNVCLNVPSAFTYLGSGTITTYEWDFDQDGVTDVNDMNPQYVFPNDGTFPVELKITTNQGCRDSLTLNATVHPLPVADYTTTFVCEPESNTYTDNSTMSSGSIVTHRWDFGNGSSSNLESPTHSFASYGIYDVELLVTSNRGCQDSVTKPISYYEKPQASFSLSDTCGSTAVPFNDQSTAASSAIDQWSWDATSDGVVDYTDQNSSHIYSAAGVYSVTLSVETAEGCRDTTSEAIEIYPLPTVDFDFSPLCFGEEMNFNSLSVPNHGTIAAFNWDFGDGNTGNGEQVSNLYQTSGDFNTTLQVVTDFDCVNSLTKVVTVFPKPEVSFSAAEVCLGTATNFLNVSYLSDGSPSSDIATYDWDLGDGSLASGKLVSHTYAQTGTYDVQLVATSNRGCVDSSTTQAVVNAYPRIGIASSLPQGCTVWCVDFRDSTSVENGTIADYHWEIPGVTSLYGPETTICFENPSQSVAYFDVNYSVVSAKGCRSDTSYPNYVSVFPRAIADFQYLPRITDMSDPYYYFENTSVGTTYAWDFGDGDTSSAFSPQHKYASPDTFNVQLVTNNQYDCPDTAVQPVVIKPIAAYYVPNAVSPDGDGLNEVFYIYGYNIADFEMHIFDRWGMRLFTSNDLHVGWDGTYNGEVVQNDVYVYKATLTDILGETYNLVGTVTLIR